MAQGLLFAALVWTLGAPMLKDPPKKEMPSIVGVWDVESVVVGGMKIPIAGEGMTFSPENTITPTNAEGMPGAASIYKIDTNKPVAEIDWSNGPSRPPLTRLGIFKIEGDTLTICLNREANGPRPTSFESATGTNHILWTLKRAAKKKD